MNVSRYRWIVVDDPFLCFIIKKKNVGKNVKTKKLNVNTNSYRQESPALQRDTQSSELVEGSHPGWSVSASTSRN